MQNIINEQAFESAIEENLLTCGGYIKGSQSDYSIELALDKRNLMEFIKETQPKEWEKTVKQHGSDTESKILYRLFQELDKRGSLDVLRNGFIDYGVRYKMAFFRPANTLNPETVRLYNLNRLIVTRQLHYSAKEPNKSIDMMLSVNGIPVATVELKNQFTGQTAENAKKQYIFDRNPNELLFQFKKRALVHFAVDTDNVYMTTKIDKTSTRYLPFNMGFDKGKGNPPNPNGYRTSYLWERIWQKDCWMNIIGRFMHLQSSSFNVDGKTLKKETMLFPRYHQWDVVTKLEDDVRKNGAGKNYLIQHSAGSGKSNSIAWLAYRLSSLHDENDGKIFNSVIVITDRKVLDKQLQDTIYQFEHVHGVVEKIDKDSKQLAAAIKSGTQIIITTLQKFPYILDKINELPERNYALIVDEAHSSQGGTASDSLKSALSVDDLEKSANADKETSENDFEDIMRETMQARGRKPNLSFFAFTATPKAKTLEIFGEQQQDGSFIAFHLYSMRQAIEEGFILDVLQNYTTYKMYFELSKQIEDDPRLNKKKAKRAIARFVSIHPHNLSQKTEVIVEHFRNFTMKQIGGQAKAMVVTASRPHVVRYKQEFDRYIKEKGYKDIRTLVAFTSFTDDQGIKWTETDINKIGEKELPDKFASKEYQILLVAEKYQTGFDQPLLHTMYVDKQLSGVKAVQTLSRLNRTYPGKTDTFILDFVNEREDILDAFQPYFETTMLEKPTNPNVLYDLKARLEKAGVFWQSEIDSFCRVFFQHSHTKKDHSIMNSYIDPAVDRFKALDKEGKRDDFKHSLTVFLRSYAFLCQIMSFQDLELEKLYAYGRLLIQKLPKKDLSDQLKIGDEVALDYYRLQKIGEGSITMQIGVEEGLKPLTDAGQRKDKDEIAPLSEIITILNERFGTDFTDADKLFFAQIEAALLENETLSKQAKNNSIDNFQYSFKEAFINTIIERIDSNQEIFTKIMDNNTFKELVEDWMLSNVYKKFRVPVEE